MLLAAAALFIVVTSACGGPTYEVVEVRENAVEQAGVTYDGIRVVTKMNTVDEDEVKFIASDLAHNNRFRDRTDTVVLFVRNEEGTSSRSALVDFEDGSYTML